MSAVHGGLDPSDWVLRWAHLVPPGASVLDVACGRGRHARLFAGRGCRVLAVDRDAEALATLEGVAGIAVRQADLEGAPWPFAPGTFDALIVTNYLHRPQFPHLAAALRPGGVLVYETFMLGNASFGKPSNPDFLLRPGELLAAFSGALTVAGFEQGVAGRPPRAVMQRISAVRGPAEASALPARWLPEGSQNPEIS
jgi:SAM-dependent methyltransferase